MMFTRKISKKLDMSADMQQRSPMIIDFSVKNFLSFKDTQKISFVASNYDKDTLPENLIDPKISGELEDLRLLKGLAIYGANAAGKSNVLSAMGFLKHLVTYSATKTNEGDEIPVAPFALDLACENEPCEFLIRFVVGGVRYHFSLALNKQRILFESLSAFPKGREQVWYAREWDEEQKNYSWEPERPTGYNRDPVSEKKTRSNALYLSTAVNLNDEQLAPVYLFFKDKFHFLRQNSERYGQTPDFTARLMQNNEEMKKLILQMMKGADLGLLSAHIKEVEFKTEGFLPDTPKEILDKYIGKKYTSVRLSHKGHDGREFSTIDWDDESDGTKKYFSLIGRWLDMMVSGYCVGIDEIETSLHPMMVVELLRFFFASKSDNTPQIIFTTHNPLLLDQTLLRRDQIWFADKDDEGATLLSPLTDYKPRKGESLVRGYMAGRYGAVPFIPGGLFGKDDDAQ
jgi:hypothetical protein